MTRWPINFKNAFSINLVSQSKRKSRFPLNSQEISALLLLLELAKFDVILIRFSSFSILYNFENDGFSTHYFSFHTLLVPIQYQLFFSLLWVVPVACRSFDYSKNNHLLVCKSIKKIIIQNEIFDKQKFSSLFSSLF